MKIVGVRKTTYRGQVPYLVVTAKGMKQAVPEVDCIERQSGWEVQSARITPRMVNSCTFTGGTTLRSVGDDTFLIPEAYGDAIRPGLWIRRKAYTVSPSDGFALDLPNLINVGVPVYATTTLEAFTSNSTLMGPGSEAEPLFEAP